MSEKASWKAFHDAFYGKSNVMEGKLLVGGGNRLVAEAFLIEKALIFFP